MNAVMIYAKRASVNHLNIFAIAAYAATSAPQSTRCRKRRPCVDWNPHYQVSGGRHAADIGAEIERVVDNYESGQPVREPRRQPLSHERRDSFTVHHRMRAHIPWITAIIGVEIRVSQSIEYPVEAPATGVEIPDGLSSATGD